MAFNAKQFLSKRQTGGFDTHFPVIPEGEFPALLTKWDARVQQMQNDKDDPSKGTHPQLIVTAFWRIDDAGVKETTGMQEPTCRQDFWADADFDSSGNPIGLQKGTGKNISLGRFLDSVGKNLDNFSFEEVVNIYAMVTVVHRENKENKDNPFQNVSKVVPLT